jgi:hypothetical protein
MNVQENINEQIALKISEAWNSNDLGRIAELCKLRRRTLNRRLERRFRTPPSNLHRQPVPIFQMVPRVDQATWG